MGFYKEHCVDHRTLLEPFQHYVGVCVNFSSCGYKDKLENVTAKKKKKGKKSKELVTQKEEEKASVFLKNSDMNLSILF